MKMSCGSEKCTRPNELLWQWQWPTVTYKSTLTLQLTQSNKMAQMDFMEKAPAAGAVAVTYSASSHYVLVELFIINAEC